MSEQKQCESEGGEWVSSYTKRDGTYVDEYCRRKGKKLLSFGWYYHPDYDGSNKIVKPTKDEELSYRVQRRRR